MNDNKLFASDKMQALRYRMVAEELYRTGYDAEGRFAYYYFVSASGKSYMCTDIYTGVVYIFNIYNGGWDILQRQDLPNLYSLALSKNAPIECASEPYVTSDLVFDIIEDSFINDAKTENKDSENLGIAKSKTDQLMLACRESLYSAQTLLRIVVSVLDYMPNLASKYDKDTIDFVKTMYTYLLDNNYSNDFYYNDHEHYYKLEGYNRDRGNNQTRQEEFSKWQKNNMSKIQNAMNISDTFNKLGFISGLSNDTNGWHEDLSSIFCPNDKYIYTTAEQRHRLMSGDSDWNAKCGSTEIC